MTLASLLIGLLLSIAYGVADYFTDQGIDESIIYHLRYGLGEAGFAEYILPIGLTVIALIALAVLFYYFIKNISRRQKDRSAKNKLAHVPIFLALLAIGFNPASKNIYSLVSAEFSSQTINNEEYIKVSEKFVKEPLNLIYIYAESLEETYFDEKLFPGLMPNLNNVRNKAIVFKDVAQVTHSGWTIAGMVASQCGVPLFSASQGNAMSGMPQFLSGATCLGDVLSRNKYALSYLGGASLEFAGKGHFYKTHGFSSVQGREELREQLVDTNYTSAWGLYDDSLFSIAKQTLAKQASQNNPFALFILTLGTHHPRGHLSASCTDYNYADGDNAMLNAVHCSDALISELIDYIQSNGLDENTLIVIGSDHLAMKNTASGLLNQGDRKNMLIMIPPDLPEGRVINTPSSILDVSATILPLIGFETEALGFGRNILNDKTPQLIEQHESFNSYLNSASALVASFWQYPQAVNDIRFDDEKSQAYFGEQSINYPALFLIDDNNATEQVLFEFNSDKKLSGYLQAQEQGRKILWIDQCTKLNAVFESVERPNEQASCVAIGRLGSEKVWVEQLQGKPAITKNEIKALLAKEQSTVSLDRYLKHIKVLSRLAATGSNADTYQVLPKDSTYQSIFVKSAAGLAGGESFITYIDDSVETKLQGFSRGLNLIGFTQGQPAEIIHQFDTCQAAGSFRDDENIVAVLDQHQHDFYLLVAQDSTICSSDEALRHFMLGSRLELWSKLVWRQAYAAIIYQDGTALELLGENDQSVNVILK
ncbi:MAG: sulfatase-like hydrolase/transferase [Pseudomonas sp.]|nr:sulfatase-like hydrolase/transferase [Pseudomonas sp.]